MLTLGGVDVERVTERAELLVRRHSLALAAAVTRALGPDVDGSLGLVAGGLSFIHASRSLSPMFLAGETRHHLRMFVAPEGRVAWSVAPTLALALTIGLDVVVNAPRFAVVTASGRTGVYELAKLQPRLGLALEWGPSKYR